jgi:hypothetical protein
VIENIAVYDIPSKENPAMFSCKIVSLWAREIEDNPVSGQMRVLIDTPDLQLPDSISLEIDLTKTPFHRTRITIGALPMIAIGRFEFRIEFRLAEEDRWQSAAKLPFIVTSQGVDENPLMS